jgi:hypothetical protein
MCNDDYYSDCESTVLYSMTIVADQFILHLLIKSSSQSGSLKDTNTIYMSVAQGFNFDENCLAHTGAAPYPHPR